MARAPPRVSSRRSAPDAPFLQEQRIDENDRHRAAHREHAHRFARIAADNSSGRRYAAF
jgi:hypothetical protein